MSGKDSPWLPKPRSGIARVADSFDVKDPRSCLNLMPLEMLVTYLKNKDYVDKCLRFEEARTQPPALVFNLRSAFWTEYERVILMNVDRMERTNIFAGICGSSRFSQLVKDPDNIAWILSSPTAYELQMEAALELALNKVREILAFPLYEDVPLWKVRKKKGDEEDMPQEEIPTVRKPALENAKLVVQVYKMLEDRVKGPVVQRVEQFNKNMNANFTKRIGANEQFPSELLQSPSQNDMAQLEQEKMQLVEEMKHLAAPNSNPVIVMEDDERKE